MIEQLKSFGGPGLFSSPLSTSNLYQPQLEKISGYLQEDEQELFDLLSRRLCQYHDAKYSVLFSTGFWALVATIKLKALGGKSQVIIPSLTYRRLADVVYWAGLTPVFVDVDQSISICPASVEAAISKETALILAVHPIINCCDVSRILSLSESHQIPVIFDAVESVHETVAGKRIGSFGVGEVFSMHASKFINGLEGGYVCTDDQDFADALNRFTQGLDCRYRDNLCVGLNGLPTSGHAAFALAGLDEIAQNVKHNKKIYQAYQSHLPKLKGIDLVAFDEVEQTSYKNIVTEITEGFPVSRDRLVEILNTESILARKHYTPPLHKKHYEYPTLTTNMKNTEYFENRLINLPCGSRVSTDQVEKICDIIKLITQKQLS